MSEKEESDYESEIESYDDSEEEIIKLETNVSEESIITSIESNKFYPYLIDNIKLPSDYMAHALIMHRVDSFARGAEPLIEDPKRSIIESGSVSYDEIKNHFVELALEEIKQGVSPMVYRDPLFNVERSINFLNTDMLINIINEKINLSNI